jgi:hypothetical protein
MIARIEQRSNLASGVIDSRQVTTLMQTTPIAGERQVGRIISTQMLAGNDMVDMKCSER